MWVWENEKAAVVLYVCIAIIVGSVCIRGCVESEKTTREYIKAGYVQEQKEGTTETYWTKK
jgi:hypothetical protein